MTTPHKADLFAPGHIGAIPVANRIAMAPLTRSRADMEGVPSPFAAEYYRQRASAGLIVAEATNISRAGRGYALTPGIYTDAHVAGWAGVTKAVHEQFSLANPAVAAVIPGASRPGRIAEDSAALQEKVPADFWWELRNAGLVNPAAPLPLGD